jgi:hypothetical protein
MWKRSFFDWIVKRDNFVDVQMSQQEGWLGDIVHCNMKLLGNNKQRRVCMPRQYHEACLYF